MQKQALITIAISMALVSMAVQTTAHTIDESDGWAVSVSPDGLVTETGGSNFGVGECEATAPEETYCATLVHASAGEPHHTLFGDFVSTYTLESRLIHADGARVLQVTVVEGTLVDFQEYGDWPTGPFWQDCFAYEPGSAGSEPPFPFEPNGEPGGDGDWGCRISGTVI